MFVNKKKRWSLGLKLLHYIFILIQVVLGFKNTLSIEMRIGKNFKIYLFF